MDTPDLSVDEAKGPTIPQPTDVAKAPRQRRQRQSEEGAKARPRYHHRDEDYILVTRDDLREIKGFGWLQQGLLSVGTFFFSGAFWLFAELLANQEKFAFTAWLAMCVVSMGSGAVLIVASLIFYSMRQKRLDKYFGNQPYESLSEVSQSHPLQLQHRQRRQQEGS